MLIGTIQKQTAKYDTKNLSIPCTAQLNVYVSIAFIRR